MSIEGTAIVVTYNSAGFIGECLDSMGSAADDGRLKVVVVDNASVDGTVDIVSSRFPWAKIIRSHWNRGFGAGNNLGFEKVEGDWCLFLNPDAVVVEGALDELARFLADHSEVVCVGPAVLDGNGKRTLSYFPFTGLLTSLWSAVGLQRILPLNRTNGRRELRCRPPNRSVEVDRLLGAAMMVKRRALDAVGRFDERFFLYSDEEDLCLRLRQAGWKVCYHPEASVVHRGSGCAEAGPLTVAAANWSRYLFMRKHCSRLSAEVSRTVWIAMLVVRYLLARTGLLFGRTDRKIEGYRQSIRSLMVLRYFDRVLRPGKIEMSVNRAAH